MSSRSGRNRDRRPGRRPPFRDPRPRLLIVCEGKVTEPQYFEQFANSHRNPLVKVVVAKEHGVPLTIVEVAREKKAEADKESRREGDENIRFDSVWCVFDVDEHPNIPQARSLAARCGIDLAVSNPCFELWLLLHLTHPPGMLHRRDAQAALRLHVGDYDKGVDYTKTYRDGYEMAVRHATYLDRLAESMNDPGRNPTTNVYVLTERIIAP